MNPFVLSFAVNIARLIVVVVIILFFFFSSNIFDMKVTSCTHSFALLALSILTIQFVSGLSIDSKGKPST